VNARKLLWDLPTRLFHWTLVLLLPLSWWSAEQDNYQLHQWLGFTFISLVLFRIIWGLCGSTHSRFSDFLTGPGAILTYLREGRSRSAGHNPLGAWSVVLLLSLLLLQGISGLFNTDDVLYSAPLYYAASTELRDALGAYHEWGFYFLITVVTLHIVAVLFYQLRRRQALIQAMIRGWAPGRAGTGSTSPTGLALVLLVTIAGALGWGLEPAPQPQPMW
jgi:cytochrome b